MTTEPIKSVLRPCLDDLFMPEDDPDGELIDRHYPPAWHGGVSRAVKVCAPLRISARVLVDAPQSLRVEMADFLSTMQTTRFVRRAVFMAIVAAGCAMFLKNPIRIFAVAAVVLKAGADFGRYVAALRLIRSLPGLTPDDLELAESPSSDRK